MRDSVAGVDMIRIPAWANPLGCFAFAVIAFMGLSGAAAAADEDLKACQQKDTPAVSIPACTRLIDSGEESGDFLGTLYALRALADVRAGDYAKAVADLTEVLRLKPHAPERAYYFSFRALSHFYAGEYAQAISDYNTCIRLKPKESFGYNGRAYVYLKLKNYDAAMKDYDAALKRDPKSAQSLYGRGLVKRAKGDATGADADMSKAKEIQSDVAAGFVHDGVDAPP
ncbi:MAG: tetratricopeptide repeat protein [Planctomycetia bacterium]|nr:tetratricopeptide repeat protein [Planctomycetia bacterium]